MVVVLVLQLLLVLLVLVLVAVFTAFLPLNAFEGGGGCSGRWLAHVTHFYA